MYLSFFRVLIPKKTSCQAGPLASNSQPRIFMTFVVSTKKIKHETKTEKNKTKQKRIVSIRFAFTKNLLTWDWSHLHVYFNSSSIYTYKFFIKTNKKLTSLHLSTFYFKQSFKCHSGFLKISSKLLCHKIGLDLQLINKVTFCFK